MKKSLLIILSLIFMCMSAHAVGVDCWEEVDATFNPNTVSKMQAVLGNNVTITRVKTELKTLMYERHLPDCTSYLCYHLEPVSFYLHDYVIYNYSAANNPHYLNLVYEQSTSKNYGTRMGGIYTSSKSLNYPLTLNSNYLFSFETLDKSSSKDSLGVYEYTSEDAKRASHAAFIHTYCIENTNSGGGGGAAGASVNYIIKAN